MAHPQIALFARLADGDEKPSRVIEGQKTLLGRTMHAIDYDAVHDEIILPQPFAQAILTFRGSASGEEAPIRVLQGPKTRLGYADRSAVDPINNEIFVPQRDKILVFAREANGDVAPIRVLQGPDTRIADTGPGSVGQHALAVDPVNNLLVLANERHEGTVKAIDLLIFNSTDQGNVKPRAVISGPKTGLTSSRVRIYKDWIVVSQDGYQVDEIKLTGMVRTPSWVGIWSIHDNGNVAPRWTIGGPGGMLRKPRGIAFDPENKTVMVSDKLLNAVMTYSVPEIFN